MASCSDISEDFEVQKYSNKKLQVLYKGEGSSKILKVTANRGNCKVYDANYYKNNFKNGNNLVSGNETLKLCYSDILKNISSILSPKKSYSCQDLSKHLSSDLSQWKIIGGYEYKPLSKNQIQKLEDTMKYIRTEEKLRTEIARVIVDIEDILNINFMGDRNEIVKLINSWDKKNNFNKINLPPYHKYQNGVGYVPLNQNEINHYNQAIQILKQYVEAENNVKKFDEIAEKEYGFDSNKLRTVLDNWGEINIILDIVNHIMLVLPTLYLKKMKSKKSKS